MEACRHVRILTCSLGLALIIGCTVYDISLLGWQVKNPDGSTSDADSGYGDAASSDRGDNGRITSDASESDSGEDADLRDADLRDAESDDEMEAGPSDAQTDEAGCIFVPENELCPKSCPEVCNARDDDCDGLTDESPAEISCSLPNAVAECDLSLCLISECKEGFANCDGLVTNGCEVPLGTDTDCTACGDTCQGPRAQTSCASGSCRIVTCDTGYASCDDSPYTGCETVLGTANDCEDCDDTCERYRATQTSCQNMACRIEACEPGWGDCDAENANGCEAELATDETCIACTETCSLDNASASCVSGYCHLDSCDSDFGNCDGDTSNGCEQPLTTLNHCADCDTPCDLDNAEQSCVTGSCLIETCSSGYDDCNDADSDGCETAINTLTDCAACNQPCDLENAEESCLTGSCQITACDIGYSDCDEDPDNGCEHDNSQGECPTATMRVQFYSQTGDLVWIRPAFKIFHDGGETVSLSELTLRYWYTIDSGSTDQIFECWQAGEPKIDCGDVSAGFVPVSGRTDADYYMQLEIASSDPLAAGEDTGEIPVGWHKSDWSNYDYDNDWSYEPFSSYTDSPKITLYQNGTLVWGDEP